MGEATSGLSSGPKNDNKKNLWLFEDDLDDALFSSCTTRSIPSSITVNFSPLHLSSLQSYHRRSFLISCDSSRCRSSFGDSHDNNNYLEASLLLSRFNPALIEESVSLHNDSSGAGFKDPSPHVNGRYSDHMLPEVEVKDFRMDAQISIKDIKLALYKWAVKT
ncbi:hypothetical protein JHK86_033785 [Glycine max]|nr:hypothetical protein JHK86_033785 [Glycine max]